MFKIPTYQDQLNLVAAGVAKVSVNGNLSTFKYHRKVLFDNLWDKYPDVMECRGHTYDNQTGELLILPFRKTFNYLERNTWEDVPPGKIVVPIKKFNGFMGGDFL